MNAKSIAIGIVLTLATGAACLAADAATPAEPPGRHVDLAICLDTSGSMNGLIDAARMKLWDIVNTLAQARPRPIFRVGLYEYGNSRLKDPWVRKVLDLTDDLDTVYKELMALTTNGGTEYVARVVTHAVKELSWSKDKEALKIIFVAGNEPASQDPTIKPAEAGKTAIEAGIIVNTIHCGDHQTGINTAWQEVAQAADGQYASIDQNKTFAVVTPVDARLGELNKELNKTYVAYGARGAEGAANQAAQDANAARLGAPAAAQRAAAKGSGLYQNAGWDLVDASKQKDFKLDAVKEEELPENMKTMKPEDRKAYVEEMGKKREGIQAEIQKLAVEQRAFIETERARNAAVAGKSLDAAMLGALTKQAEAKGFQFESAATTQPANPTTQPEDK